MNDNVIVEPEDDPTPKRFPDAKIFALFAEMKVRFEASPESFEANRSNLDSAVLIVGMPAHTLGGLSLKVRAAAIIVNDMMRAAGIEDDWPPALVLESILADVDTIGNVPRDT